MSSLFYRFRKTQSVFDFQELENEEIYFASKEELNDPMEGYKNLIFNGDEIVWINIFRHYLRCLDAMWFNYLIDGEQDSEDFSSNSIPIFIKVNEFPTDIYKELFEDIWNDVFNIYGIVIKKIVTRTTPITREELFKYMSTFNIVSISIINKHYELKSLMPKKNEFNNDYSHLIESIIKSIDAIEENIKINGYDKLGLILDQTIFQSNETFFIKLMANEKNKIKSRKLYLLNFTKPYLKAIEKLTYPEVYTASFTGEEAINNSSVWGHYGDSHKGICLIFETDSEKKSLNFLNAKTGWSSSKGITRGKVSLKFEKIKYEKDYPEIDFFRSLGSLPQGQITSDWYSNDKGMSTIYDEIFNNQGSWREAYWNKFSTNNLIKMKDWEYEKEYRVILNSGMDSQIDKEYRLLKYSFNSLKGIIFGINTAEKDKLKIIDIINKKCSQYERKNFTFYQAYHCNFRKNIQFTEIK
ncbi:DUF2971 domain-containing protein [Francisella philomiragia]|uniref:DUF2971 domain-containing protein n=1 Tax=Francisella philomiragia TaxID=28110 RepID=UPI0019036205|nr:DUF2971 domain-containing protein [Francisella philomiragia]MBK2266511.1 DUF2971 domain-containing protein [Francisella philomiragia]MBK2278321.1 DUF2971 domain-containing protein [Francisella philomiragia]MBK2286177.1 DUF2971 domain-containing protein [Francisella philomiragia]MBK2287794.1 DUF2971 domain-containing protein [Francisella philomiragia]MBK2290136.1 DUF2971 domain-containing protein [Francisella philomiragia]